MNELLKTVLSLSISGTLLFFIILAFKQLYKDKLCKRWQYYIWLIVIARMLLPFTPEATLVGSVFEYFGNTNEKTVQTVTLTDDILWGLDTPDREPQASDSNPKISSALSIQEIFSKVYDNVWILWVVIAFALLMRKITMYQSFVRFVKVGWTEVSDIEILNMLADAGEKVGVKRPVELFTNPLISSPMILGFFRPYIILPSVEQERKELAYIMQHELTHYKHLDMFYKWLVQITVCLHWFNPFSYLLAKEISKCCELSCDESVIKTMDQTEKKAYGDTLLNALKAMGNYKDKLAGITLTEGATQLKERLDAIMKCRKSSKIAVSMMLLLTLVLAVGAAAIGAYAATPASTDLNNNTTKMAQTSFSDDSANTQEPPSASNPDLLPIFTKENPTREESLIESFEPFRPYGLVYDAEQDKVFFNGQEVRAFADPRDPSSEETYSFELAYIDSESNSNLYLMTVRDETGSITGITEMSKEFKRVLAGGVLVDEKDDTSPAGNEEESLTSGKEYIVFDKTTKLEEYSITATDRLDSGNIPKTVAEWILTCQGTEAYENLEVFLETEKLKVNIQ